MNPARTLRIASTVTFLALIALPAPAGDWPQWRGADRDGHAKGESGLLEAWPEDGPPLAWRAGGLGGGYSSLAVVGPRLYTMGDIGGSQYAIAMNRRDGSIAWKTRVGPEWKDQFGGPRATPTVAGKRVFVVGTEGDVVALSADKGEELWRRNLAEEFGGFLMKARGTYDWKFSESVLVDDGRVIVSPGSPESTVVALDATSGKTLWSCAVPKLGEKGLEGAGYSSAVVSNAGGVKQYVQFVGRGVVGIEAATGRLLWGYNGVANHVANIPTPIVDGDHVFVSSGYGAGAALLRIAKGEGGAFKAEEVYFLEADTMQNHHGGMVLLDGIVYTGTGHNKGFPLAVRMSDGQVMWGPERNEGEGSAAVTLADGRLYYRYQNGTMVLIDADPAGYSERGTFEIPEVAQFSWAHPVISGGQLFLREQDNLFVYDLRRKQGQVKKKKAAP